MQSQNCEGKTRAQVVAGWTRRTPNADLPCPSPCEVPKRQALAPMGRHWEVIGLFPEVIFPGTNSSV